MAGVTVRLNGVKQAQAQIAAYRLSVIKEINRAALETGYLIEASAKGFVRVDTGRLRSSINTSFRTGGLFDSRITAVEVGTNVSYAMAQEFGDPRKPNYGYTPYLFPAYEMHKNGFLESVKKILKK